MNTTHDTWVLPASGGLAVGAEESLLFERAEGRRNLLLLSQNEPLAGHRQLVAEVGRERQEVLGACLSRWEAVHMALHFAWEEVECVPALEEEEGHQLQ
jgi:hypothetical protein